MCLVSRNQILTAMEPAAKQKMKLLSESGVTLEPIPTDRCTLQYSPAQVANEYAAYIETVWRNDGDVELPDWLKADVAILVSNWPTKAAIPKLIDK